MSWEKRLKIKLAKTLLFEGIVVTLSVAKAIDEFIDVDVSKELKEELKKERERTLKEAVKLSDEIEAGKETKFEEWRAFKSFRNTLRDKYLKEKPKTPNRTYIEGKYQ